jgi:hypothetical protein
MFLTIEIPQSAVTPYIYRVGRSCPSRTHLKPIKSIFKKFNLVRSVHFRQV